ncbi:ArnT family glycosyltransferase [Streptomyces turgidiscabies]|uniref:Dolichyl-phosphate-mannose-protein mannosyltransferase n=2 Tax=Streptomyces TaxID=1883 RepID=L7FF08_STRT8|nr:glycosyltransferase family 39 protein [Streptomyces turgidiscabies]ELP69260.1 dolichyl-phosphate-mannose-protein mannosyltransferase [Streptomyces turgidiscabies Car8]MDX3500160.1 glycosyltransferase family 39 protein [Streptomyces turgidiscabies]GAQ77273.1 undecaprenyl [Streptomyces turgidiscabies]
MTTHFDQTTYSGPGGANPSSPPSPDSTAVQQTAVTDTDRPGPSSGEPNEPFVRRLWRGRPEDHRWVRPAFLATLLVIGALYTWNLTASGYANSFYSAAVQAGSQSWKAFFFGSLDASNAITVDKPPASLWPMALSVRLFGLNSFAILFPQVLMAVATAGVLYASVRRRFDATAGLLTMAAFATTPVAALMFRFNNPDALLALLMAVAVYCTQRAMEKAQTKWLLWAGTAIGFAFLVKTLQAFLILPVLALVYVIFAPTSVRRRIGQVLAAGLAMIVAGGWWVAIVELWPASSRPYIGGSQNNSFLELTFGYNGLGRINGDETGSVGGGGGGGGTGMWGETGWNRMFSSGSGGQISWLIPAALILLVAAIWAGRKARRTDTARAGLLLWGGSLLITMVIFSFMQGIFHDYYTVALAPYIAPLVGMGAALLWQERDRMWASLSLAGAMTATAVWGYVLLNRSSDYLPWLKWLVLVGGLTAALGLIFVNRLGRQLALAVVGLSFVTALAGPTAYSLTTLNEGHTGSIVTAGPSVQGGRGGMGGGPGGGGGGMGGQRGQQNGTGNTQGGGMGQPPTGGFPGGGNNTQGNQQQGNGNSRSQGNQQGGMPGGGATGEGGGMGGGGGVGGLLNGASVSSEAKALLEKNAGDYTWAAAAIGAQNAASYQLSTGDPVMAIGGFNGTDPSPTLAEFKKYVANGKIHYFISSGSGGGGMGGSSTTSTSSQISSWIESNFKEVTVGSATFYDLTQPTSSS